MAHLIIKSNELTIRREQKGQEKCKQCFCAFFTFFLHKNTNKTYLTILN